MLTVAGFEKWLLPLLLATLPADGVTLMNLAQAACAKARRVGKTWRARECESDLQGGKTGRGKKDLPEGRSEDSGFVMRLA